MSKLLTVLEQPRLNARTKLELVALLNLSLADTLDLAYQTKQAHWNVKGPTCHALHLLFDQLHVQLGSTVDELSERVVALGGQALGTGHAVGRASHLEEYPLNIRQGVVDVNALIDRYGDYTHRIRRAGRKAERLGDQPTADLYTSVSRAMDQALWLLTASGDD